MSAQIIARRSSYLLLQGEQDLIRRSQKSVYVWGMVADGCGSEAGLLSAVKIRQDDNEFIRFMNHSGMQQRFLSF